VLIRWLDLLNVSNCARFRIKTEKLSVISVTWIWEILNTKYQIVQPIRYNGLRLQLRTITLLANTESERETRQRLLDLFKKYPDLEKWTFTENLVIRDDGFSHSYPELTLATNQLVARNDQEFISIYVHENLHVFLSLHPKNFYATIADLRISYPNVPIGRVNGVHLGGRDEESTYIHLIVGYLEYMAMMQLFGKESATEILRNHDYLHMGVQDCS
jgi:hypothetical protein